jgi:very-short-patch-repair endonuclease
VAARQYGLITARQLARCGVNEGAIQYRVQQGTLHRVHRGIYAVGHPSLTSHGRWLAAVLASGPGAALSHRSAAALWRLLPADGGPVDVTGERVRRGERGVRFHRARRLTAVERARVDGIAVTKVSRTLLDLAETCPTQLLDAAFDAALRRRLITIRGLRRVLARNPGRHGLRPLRALIDDRRRAPTRSELERRFLRLCRVHGIVAPEVNARVAGLEVDALWRHRRLVVELDSWEYHGARDSFERDRARSARLQLAGYEVLRVTYRWIDSAPAEVAAAVASLLAR